MPIAFVEQAGRFVPMAVMGLTPEHNLFVGPEGQWLGGYLPAAMRSYPFRLLRSEGSEQMTLCVDEDSGLVVDLMELETGFSAAMESCLSPFRHSWSSYARSKGAGWRPSWQWPR